MNEVKVSAIIHDSLGRILLQLRDEDPEKDMWVLFGGSVEKDETEEEAIKREIKEELDYQIEGLHLFKRYQYRGVEQPIYVVEELVSPEGLKLREGANMKFFSPQKIISLNIGFNYKEIILDYLRHVEQSP